MIRTQVIRVYVFTFLVALCSIVYELMFSQIFTIVFGGTVRQYSITIGLYLFSLGLGSYLYEYVRHPPEKVFVVLEIVISTIGLLGVVGLVVLSGWLIRNQAFGIPHWVVVVMAYVPVMVVGVLSGLEIPLLTQLGTHHGVKTNVFGKVLGTDYLGSLVGTIAFALVLYPHWGILVSAFMISFIGVIVAVAASWSYHQSKTIKVISVLLMIAYLVASPFALDIQDQLIKGFRSARISAVDSADGRERMQVEISKFMSTPYQDVMIADVRLNPRFFSLEPLNYTCLYLDNDQQFCDPFVESYHGGLVDLPMQFVKGPAEVLVIGGGDWIGVKNLLAFDEVTKIDLVDIDEGFAQLAMHDPFISKYNQGSFDDPRVNPLYEDGFFYVLSTQKSYDLIVVDLPGVTHDKLSGLYSVEFFSNIKRILRPGAVVVTWIYDAGVNPAHARVFDSTIKEAGFSYRLDYLAYRDSSRGLSASEEFTLMALEPLEMTLRYTPYLNQTRIAYQKASLSWRPVDETFKAYPPVRVHSVFRPNYDIVIPMRGF